MAWARVLALAKREQVPEYSGGRFGQVQWLCGHRGQKMSRVLSPWKAAFLSQPHICRPLPTALSCSWGDDAHTKWGDSRLSTGNQHPTLSLPERMSQQEEREGTGQGHRCQTRLLPGVMNSAQYLSEPLFPHLDSGNAHSHLAGHCEELNGGLR